MKYKGIDFATNRMACHLQKYYRKYGNCGYALVFDFSKYFDRIDHDKLKDILRKIFSDEKPCKLIFTLIDDFGEVGLGLGSQISQICALAYPNMLDHYIKEVLHVNFYGRYMDDGYLLHPDKNYLKFCLEKIKEICNYLGIVLNEKKTQIIKISNGITFLKEKFIISSTGAIIRKPARKGVTKMRHKLKTFKTWVDNGKMQLIDVQTAYVSWKGHMARMNSYRTVKSMNELFKRLFIGESKNEVS